MVARSSRASNSGAHSATVSSIGLQLGLHGREADFAIKPRLQVAGVLACGCADEFNDLLFAHDMRSLNSNQPGKPAAQ